MAPIGTLYSTAGTPDASRVLATASYAGVEVTSSEFDAKTFPVGTIIAFEGPDFWLYESSAIIKYIASQAPNSTLLGSSAEQSAQIDEWIAFAISKIRGHTTTIYQLVTGAIVPYAKPIHTALADKQIKALETLDRYLAARTFLVTERVTAADIFVAGELQFAFTVTLGAAERAKFPNVTRWVDTVANQPKIKEHLGSATYVDKPLAFVPPAKDKKPAAEKPKAEAKPKAEPKPKAEKKKEVEEEEEDDLVPKEEPKAKNPLDFLPKSTFNLEDWKRAYSNMDTRGPGGSIEWFYKNFDSEGFSVWRVDFKYNDELTQTFMSSNQIGGFFNRLEASRKYLFGSVGVLGQTNDSVISGVLIARGPDIKPVVEVAPDWESYSYSAIDLKDEAQKAFFEAALAWDLEIDGKKWVDGKNFK